MPHERPTRPGLRGRVAPEPTGNRETDSPGPSPARIRWPKLPCVAIALILASGFGCSSPNSRVQVTPATGLPWRPGPRQEWGPERPHQRLVPSEVSRLEKPTDVRFAQARQAYWDGDGRAAAVEFLALAKETRESEERRHLQHLALQAYEETGQWAESLRLYEPLGLLESHKARIDFARTATNRPDLVVAFADKTVAIPFDLAFGQLVIASGTVNGHPGRFLLDTGFSSSLVTEAFARKAGVEPEGPPVTLTDSGSRDRTVGLGRIQELRLGSLIVSHLPAVISPPRLLKFLDANLDGVLGWDVLQRVRTTWDFPKRRLEFSPTVPGDAVLRPPNLTGRRAPILRALSAEGGELDLFLDTGYSARPPGLKFFDNEGILATKVDPRSFRRSWLPGVSIGMQSFRIHWTRRARDFEFETAGHRFRMPLATRHRRTHLMEGLALADGMIGNAPFLGGTLILDGPARRLSFQVPAP